jgi:hypothetical protein
MSGARQIRLMPPCADGDMASIYSCVVLKDRQGEPSPEILAAFSTDAWSLMDPYHPAPPQSFGDSNKRMDVYLHRRPKNWSQP